MMNDAKNESSFQLNYREYYSDRANRDTTCLFLDAIAAQHQMGWLIVCKTIFSSAITNPETWLDFSCTLVATNTH